jgi:hypothetical protein
VTSEELVAAILAAGLRARDEARRRAKTGEAPPPQRQDARTAPPRMDPRLAAWIRQREGVVGPKDSRNVELRRSA